MKFLTVVCLTSNVGAVPFSVAVTPDAAPPAVQRRLLGILSGTVGR